MNIPIYRAKGVDKNFYFEGDFIASLLSDRDNKYHDCIIDRRTQVTTKIETDTLAIHFPKMIDKNGKKIFASLSDNGAGGDIVLNFDEEQGALIFTEFGCIQYYEQFENFEVVGVQK